MEWIDLDQDRGRWQALCKGSNEPEGYIKCGEFLD